MQHNFDLVLDPVYFNSILQDDICYAGVQNSEIQDSAMTASSYYKDGYQPYYGRLDNFGTSFGFWRPAGEFNANVNEVAITMFFLTSFQFS